MKPFKIASKKHNFAYSFNPVYYFSRIFGFMPFSIAFDSNGTIRSAQVKVIDILWSLISISFNFFYAIQFAIFFGFEEILNQSFTLANSTKSIIVSRKLCNCLSIGIDMCNRFKLVGILKNVNTVDKKVNWIFTAWNKQIFLQKLISWMQLTTVGIRFNYRKERRRSIICCTVIPILASFPMLVYYMFIEYPKGGSTNPVYCFFVHFTRVLQLGSNLQFFISFAILMRSISIRFAALGDYLR